jgi:squalene-hopene/tetraprenyl-beta-curcumene cyclase
MRTLRTIAAAAAVLAGGATTASALDEAHYRTARTLIEKSIDYLRAQQDPATGGWTVRPDGPQFPAITGLVVTGMLMEPDIDAADPAVARGVEYMLSFRQPDGGIYDRVLANYNTALCLSALARVNRPDAAAAIPPAQAFLKGIQWSEESIDHPESGEVDPAHPFYGGVGYGGSSRPDNSNLNLMLQGLRDSGLSCDDESFQRALVFLERTQMHHDINDMPYAAGSQQGGFIYATSPNGDEVGVGESKAGMIDETLSDGTTASRLRAYGSMTYAGFKSYIYADLDRDDQRVRLAYDWIRRNYTLEENPGVGMQGYYYYLVTFSRALDAWGLPSIETANPDGSTAESRDWANDLIDKLAELQKEDGSFENLHDRWMEGDPVLVTAYALLALQHAIN